MKSFLVFLHGPASGFFLSGASAITAVIGIVSGSIVVTVINTALAVWFYYEANDQLTAIMEELESEP